MRGLIANLILAGVFCFGTAAFAADPELARASRNPRLGIVCLEPRSGRLDIHSEKLGCNARSGEKRVNAAQVAEMVVGTLSNQPGATGAQGVAGPQGPQGPAGAQGPVGPTAFPRLETYIFGVADSSNVIVDDQTLQGKKLCFSAGTQQIDALAGSGASNSNFVGVVVPASSGINASNFTAQIGFSMGVSPAVNVWAVNSGTATPDGSRNWRVIYGCNIPPSQTAINNSSAGRCGGRMVVTCIVG